MPNPLPASDLGVLQYNPSRKGPNAHRPAQHDGRLDSQWGLCGLAAAAPIPHGGGVEYSLI